MIGKASLGGVSPRVLVVGGDASSRAAWATQLATELDVVDQATAAQARTVPLASYDAVVVVASLADVDGWRQVVALRRRADASPPIFFVSTTAPDHDDGDLLRAVGVEQLLDGAAGVGPLLAALRPLGPVGIDRAWLGPDDESAPTRYMKRPQSPTEASAILGAERQLAARLRRRHGQLREQLSVLTALSDAVVHLSRSEALHEGLAVCFAGLPRSVGALYLYEADGSLTARPLGAPSAWSPTHRQLVFGQVVLLQQAIAAGRVVLLPSIDDAQAPPERVADAALVVPLLQGARPRGALVLTVPAEDDDVDWVLFGRAAANQITHALALAAAVTEQGRTEFEMQAQNRVRSDQAALLRLVLDSMSDGVAVADEAGQMVLWNAVAASLVPNITDDPSPRGRARTLGLYHPDTGALYDDDELPLGRACRGEAVDSVEIFVRSPDADHGVLVSAAARPLISADGELRGGVLVVHDISEQRRVQHEILRSRAEWRALVESAPDMVLRVDGDGIIRFMNRVLPGYRLEDVVGQSWLNFLVPAHRQTAQAELDRVMATGETTTHELLGYGVNGSEAWYSSHLGPVYDDDKIIGAVVVARDITQRRQTELQLMMADRMTSIGTLAASVAHEVNNPLAALLTNLDMITQELTELAASPSPPPLSADLFGELADARTAGERVRQIVRDLTHLSRADENRPSAVDLHRVLDTSTRLAWTEIRHRARLIKELGAVPLVQANEARLGQVFLNLLVNAAQAIEPGHADKNEIRVTTSVDDAGRVVVAISDTGSGILPEVRAHLFAPFVTSKPAGQGTGLGLSIVQRLLAQMGGTIDFTTELGQGTTFRITLPAASSQALAARSSAHGGSSAATAVGCGSRRGRVLIVDDEPMLVQAVARVLSREHEVVTTDSALYALETIRGGGSFDVILCDLMMPQLTGMDFYEQLSVEQPSLCQRVVFLTGGAFTPRAAHFLDTPGRVHIQKPFDLDTLRAEVNRRIDEAAPAAPCGSQADRGVNRSAR